MFAASLALSSLEEESEGAAGDNAVNGLADEVTLLAEDLEDWGVGLPLGFEYEVVFHPLVAEEHVLVAPVGGDHRRASDH